ncbi:MAG: hypothetical protein H6Q61_989, partial [Firmicutes bacterium]|nr:hypothetical protein [Bacillota bacterium]
ANPEVVILNVGNQVTIQMAVTEDETPTSILNAYSITID